VSKTPARKAPPNKTTSAKAKVVASKPAKSTKPVAAKKHAAPPAKSAKAAKPIKVVKAAHPVKSAKPAKPNPKPAVAAKPSNPSKPVTTPAKAAPPAVAAKPKLPMKPAPSPAPVPAAVTTAATAAPTGGMAPLIPRKAGRGASKYATPAVQAPLPPPTSRFADRFAPPRPPTRQMNNLELDTPREKQKFDPKLANAWKTKAGRDLTEPEVLAMPESEYMNDKQLEFFRTKLQQLKDDLLSNAGETTEHLREDTSIVPDPADRATIEEEHALELRTRDRERKLLKKISQSLGRIESGEYGFCDETGEPIGLGRLIARPTATLSLEAQQRRELKQKMFGD
jgi:DnaK suppressor protein